MNSSPKNGYKERVALGIEKRTQPVDENGNATGAACAGMIRHPDIDLMPDANIDRDKVGPHRHDVSR